MGDAFASLPGSALALALRSAADAVARVRNAQHVDVVWTGPASQDVAPRATSAVLADLIDGAHHELLVVSFAAYKVQAVLEALSAATARGVGVSLVLESAEESNGKLTQDARHAFEALGDKVAFYVWPAELRATSAGGHAAMHAKCVVAGRQVAFVTWANLTGNGIADNTALGLLVRDGLCPLASLPTSWG